MYVNDGQYLKIRCVIVIYIRCVIVYLCDTEKYSFAFWFDGEIWCILTIALLLQNFIILSYLFKEFGNITECIRFLL